MRILWWSSGEDSTLYEVAGFIAEGAGFTPGWGTKILQDMWCDQQK